jgi:hypothetical protein
MSIKHTYPFLWVPFIVWLKYEHGSRWSSIFSHNNQNKQNTDSNNKSQTIVFIGIDDSIIVFSLANLTRGKQAQFFMLFIFCVCSVNVCAIDIITLIVW